MSENKIQKLSHLKLVHKLKKEKEETPVTTSELNALNRLLSGRSSFDISVNNAIEGGGWGQVSGEVNFDLSDNTRDYIPFTKPNGLPVVLPERSILVSAYYRAVYRESLVAGEILIVHSNGEEELLTSVNKERELQGFFITEGDARLHKEISSELTGILAFRPSTITSRTTRGHIRLFAKYLKY